jgi:hypothetical protein
MHSPSSHASSYAARCEAGVEVLAAACGADVTRELSRFRDVRGALSKVWPAEIFELVLTLTERGPRGFAYLTQGASAEDLLASLHGLLEGTLTSYLEHGGQREPALLLADLFARAFPDLGELRRYSAGAQAMIVGFAPRAEDFALKVYFNTRLSTASPHRGRVLAMLALAGLDVDAAASTYDALYATTATRFHGVGVDLAAGEAPRGKVYVRCDRREVGAMAAALSSVVALEVRDALVALADQAAHGLDSASLADELELAIALRDGGERASCKVTFFFTAEHASAATERSAASFVEKRGCDAAPMRALLDALASERTRGLLHGLGFELGVVGTKVNVYAMPAR